jgi:hypothetical protein
MENAQLAKLIKQFVAGDTSLHIANQIEALIANGFPEEHPAQDLAEMLAQYRPGGGDFLYSEQDVLPPLERLLSAIG